MNLSLLCTNIAHPSHHYLQQLLRDSVVSVPMRRAHTVTAAAEGSLVGTQPHMLIHYIHWIWDPATSSPPPKSK